MAYLIPNIEPTIFTEPTIVTFTKAPEVLSLNYTTDGTSPTIARYIAYDNFDPPRPFICTVQDGRGNALFDGGFPKWYNLRVKEEWETYDDLPPSYKYFVNALHWIANPEKVANGNRNILFVCDVVSDATSYSIANYNSTSFRRSIEIACQMAEMDYTLRPLDSFPDQIISLTYEELDQYCALVLFSAYHTSAKLINDATIHNIAAFRENGNGILIITDHGNSDGTLGFFRTANYVAEQFGVKFINNYDRTPVNVGYLIDNYGYHPLWANIDRSEDLFAGLSESEVVLLHGESKTEPPSILIDKQGYTTIRFLIELESGELVFENYTYGLNTEEIILVEPFPKTVLPRQTLYFDINLAGFPEIGGLIRKNDSVIGEFLKTEEEFRINWLINTGPVIPVLPGDQITIQTTHPFVVIKTLDANRVSVDLTGELSPARIQHKTRILELAGTDPLRYYKAFHEITETPKRIRFTDKIKDLKNHFRK